MTQVAPAGWYPSPDGAPVHRWWDGAMWTDATRDGPDPTPKPPTSPEPASGWPAPEPARLGPWALVTRVFVALAGVALPLAAGVDLWQRADPPGWLTQDVALGVRGAAAGLLLVAGAFWAVWQFRLARSFPPGTPRRTPGWQILSWLVPVGWWWLPYQNVTDLFGLATGRPPRWLAAWWALWVPGTALTAFGPLQPWLGLAGALLAAASTPLAWLVVSRLTRAISPTPEHHAG